MSKTVLFCENYGAINTTLYLATRDCHNCQVTVVPGLYDLFKFFQVINERVFHNALSLVYFESYRAGRVEARGTRKIFHVFPDIAGERRYLKEFFNKHFAQLEGCEVFFHSRGHSGAKFYLLKKLSKRSRLECISQPPPPYSMTKYTPKSIRDLVSLAILKLIYGFDIVMGQFPAQNPVSYGFAYIPDQFMEKKVSWVERDEMAKDMMKDLDLSRFRVFDTGNYSVIYFDQDLIRAGHISDGATFKRELTGVFDVLGRYFVEREIARKYHPGQSANKNMIKVGDILPDFIPAEFLYKDSVKMYLTVCSTSIANVEKGLVVSLVDLITFKNDKTREQLKGYLIQCSRSDILFPKSLDEFERVVAGIKQQTGA